MMQSQEGKLGSIFLTPCINATQWGLSLSWAWTASASSWQHRSAHWKPARPLLRQDQETTGKSNQERAVIAFRDKLPKFEHVVDLQSSIGVFNPVWCRRASTSKLPISVSKHIGKTLHESSDPFDEVGMFLVRRIKHLTSDQETVAKRQILFQLLSLPWRSISSMTDTLADPLVKDQERDALQVPRLTFGKVEAIQNRLPNQASKFSQSACLAWWSEVASFSLGQSIG